MKISPQLDNIELFQLITKKHIFEFKKTIVLKHTILHVPCVDLLTWSPIKLDFVFYDFFVIYYDFSKIQLKFFFKKKGKTTVTVANSLQNRSREVKWTV